MLFTPNVRERFSKVHGLRRFHKHLRSEAYSAEAVSLLASLFHSACGHIVRFDTDDHPLGAGRKKRDIPFNQGTIEAGFEPAVACYEHAAKPSAIRICCSCLSRHIFEFMRESNPRPPGPEPGAPQLELMDSVKLLSVSFLSRCRYGAAIGIDRFYGRPCRAGAGRRGSNRRFAVGISGWSRRADFIGLYDRPTSRADFPPSACFGMVGCSRLSQSTFFAFASLERMHFVAVRAFTDRRSRLGTRALFARRPCLLSVLQA